jgi:microsomal dipeptidase-like Zn-dependent dipeptidase
MLGFSLYPHHLKDKSQCTLDSFCEMIARTADLMGMQHIGLGSDLCQDQPDTVVEWMRVGRWTKQIDYGEGSATQAGFPEMPDWFQNNRHFSNIASGLLAVGFSKDETSAIMGENWLRFYDENFTVTQG